MKNKNLVSILFATTLTACGGGGGGSDEQPSNSQNQTNNTPSFDYVFGLKSTNNCKATLFEISDLQSRNQIPLPVYTKDLVNLDNNIKRLDSNFPIDDGNYKLLISCVKGYKNSFDMWVKDNKGELYN